MTPPGELTPARSQPGAPHSKAATRRVAATSPSGLGLIPGRGVPFAAVCWWFQSCVICPQKRVWLSPLSSVHRGDGSSRLSFQGSWAQPNNGRQQREPGGGGGGAQSWGISSPLSALGSISCSDFSSHHTGPPGLQFCAPVSSDTRLLPPSTQVATTAVV